MSAEATANLRGARARLEPSKIEQAVVRHTFFVRNALLLREQRRHRAVLLAYVRSACEAAWKPTAAADRHYECVDAFEREISSWSEAQDALLGEYGTQEALAYWVAAWNALDEEHAQPEAARFYAELNQ